MHVCRLSAQFKGREHKHCRRQPPAVACSTADPFLGRRRPSCRWSGASRSSILKCPIWQIRCVASGLRRDPTMMIGRRGLDDCRARTGIFDIFSTAMIGARWVAHLFARATGLTPCSSIAAVRCSTPSASTNIGTLGSGSWSRFDRLLARCSESARRCRASHGAPERTLTGDFPPADGPMSNGDCSGKDEDLRPASSPPTAARSTSPNRRSPSTWGTRRLRLAGGSRRDAKHEAALGAILAALDEVPRPCSGRAIKAQLADGDHTRDTLDAALQFGTGRVPLT